ncbi:NAD(P)/FAD-dependent oxidoreductase [Streptomyces sp. NPDC059637]|uniref:NAD(P)/FAD-dependent oxidoreductase n=1 Tax=Streptomyces sp. NPDC059637 TaxID=3347752 RepID=UPI0036AE97F3
MVAVEGPEYDVVVVGGGPAGLSAALVLSRARRRVAVVDAGSPRNALATHMQGFLSRDGTPPGELAAAGRSEITGYGGEVVEDRVEGAERTGGEGSGLLVRLAGGRVLRARRLLVATGLRDELPDLPGLSERWGEDVLHCPYCHGYEVRDTPLGVLGTMDGSVHQALLIRNWSQDVVFFPHTLGLAGHEREELDARGVRVVEGEVERLVVDGGRLRGVRLADGTVVPRDTLFVSPRFVANDELLVALGCESDEDGSAEADSFGCTSLPDVWVAGNVVDPAAQVVDAVSQGSRAAVAINGDLVDEEVRRAVGERRAARGGDGGRAARAGRREE